MNRTLQTNEDKALTELVKCSAAYQNMKRQRDEIVEAATDYLDWMLDHAAVGLVGGDELVQRAALRAAANKAKKGT